MIKWKLLQKDSLVRQRKMLVIILATVLVMALVLIIGFVAWLELYMVFSIVVPRSPFYYVAVPGEPAVSARLYSLGNSQLGFDGHLLVLKSKSSRYPDGYLIDFTERKIGVPNFPVSEYIPLFSSALVNRMTLEGFPLEGELKAEWKENDREVRMCIIGFSDAAKKAEPLSPDEEEEVSRRLIGYQREIIFTKR